MKKIISLFVLVFALIGTSSAQLPYTEIKFGYFKPVDATDGYLFGVHLGRMIDESLSWGIEINYFRKTYQELTKVPDPTQQTNPNRVTKQLEFVTQILPIWAKLNYEHPIAPRSPFFLRASAGIGWEFVWNREDNYQDNISDTRFYNGFGWQLATGVGMEISSKAVLFLDAFYNGAKVKRGSDNRAGLPTWEELDISGFGLKLGVSIVGFGW
jgi:hypothetical protein